MVSRLVDELVFRLWTSLSIKEPKMCVVPSQVTEPDTSVASETSPVMVWHAAASLDAAGAFVRVNGPEQDLAML